MANELALVKSGEYRLMQVSKAELKSVFEANITGPINVFDLPRIRVSPGEALAWQVPAGGDEIDLKKSIEAVVVGAKRIRAMWRRGLDEGGGRGPPDCASDDCLSGFGVREDGAVASSMACRDCPLSKFGSERRGGKVGRGQACSETILVFIVQPETVLPSIVSLPPTSLKSWKAYGMTLTNNLVCFPDVVTRFTLKRATNADGTNYGVADFSIAARLDPEAKAALAEKLAILRDVVASHRAASELDTTTFGPDKIAEAPTT